MLCANGAGKLMNISNRWIKKTATAMFYTSCAMSGLVVWLVFVPASMNNYYGGDALSALHQIYPHNEYGRLMFMFDIEQVFLDSYGCEHVHEWCYQIRRRR